jgi:hypothetical protein
MSKNSASGQTFWSHCLLYNNRARCKSIPLCEEEAKAKAEKDAQVVIIQRMGSHSFGKPDTGTHQTEMPDPHQSQKPDSVEDRINNKIRELWRLKLEPERAVDAQKGSIEAQNEAVEYLYKVYHRARKFASRYGSK